MGNDRAWVSCLPVATKLTITLDLLTISLSNSRLFLETIVSVHRVVLHSQEHKTFSYLSSELVIWSPFFRRFYLVLPVKGELSSVILDSSLRDHYFELFELEMVFLFA